MIIPPEISKALASGYTWFVIFFVIVSSLMVFLCMRYGNQKEEGNCNNKYSCGLCLTDHVIIGLLMISLLLMLHGMIRMEDKINRNCIDAAKYDGYIMTIITEHECNTAHSTIKGQ